jgi:subtilisin family serine protease
MHGKQSTERRTPGARGGPALWAALTACLVTRGAASAAEPVAPLDRTGVSPSQAAAPAQRARFAPGHILVRLRGAADEDRFLAAGRGLGLSKRGRVYGSSWILVSIPAGADPQVQARQAAGLPGVQRASVDLVIRMADHRVPKDPLYLPPPTDYCDPLLELCVDQWGLFDSGAEGGWHVGTGDPGQVLAVLDSGVDLDHDDLYGNIWTNPGEIPANGVDDDGNGIVDDVYGADFVGDNVGGPGDDPASFDGNPDVPEGGQWVEDLSTVWGIRFDGDPATGDADDNNLDGYPDLGVFHGTAVAGIAAAMTDNLVPGSSTTYEGMAGACWNCRIMPVRMINAEGDAFLSDAAAAINYATDMGATIINASWGLGIAGLGPDSPEIAPLAEALDHAVAQGVVVVAAAGNSGLPGLSYPAADPRVIAVGSSGPTRQVSSFSSTAFAGEVPDNGLDDDGNGWVDDVIDVVAPGEAIWSTWVFAAYDSLVYQLLGDPGWPPGADTYSAADGTSFASPLVAGYLALLRSAHPGASPVELRDMLRANADPSIGGAGYDAASGFGRLQMVIPAEPPVIVNLPPEADIAGDEAGVITFADGGKSGTERVTLDGSGSSDPDGYVASWAWTWSGSDGSAGAASGANIEVELAVGPSYEFVLVVTDDAGAVSDPDSVTATLAPKSGGGGSGGGKGGGGGGKGGGKPPSKK